MRIPRELARVTSAYAGGETFSVGVTGCELRAPLLDGACTDEALMPTLTWPLSRPVVELFLSCFLLTKHTAITITIRVITATPITIPTIAPIPKPE